MVAASASELANRAAQRNTNTRIRMKDSAKKKQQMTDPISTERGQSSYSSSVPARGDVCNVPARDLVSCSRTSLDPQSMTAGTGLKGDPCPLLNGDRFRLNG